MRDTTMNCTRIANLIGPYIDEELSAALRHEVDMHVGQCPRCWEEVTALTELARDLAAPRAESVPEGLWAAIENRLPPSSFATSRPKVLVPFWRIPATLAASILLLVGVVSVVFDQFDKHGGSAQAASIDFGILLDALRFNPSEAFEKFLARYDARPMEPIDIKKYAARLNFDMPQTLPGGFQLQSAYALRFGDGPGAAGTYARQGDFLAVIFHPPVKKEDFGTHRDYSCVIGEHRGHKVEVDGWRLVHLTDATTCHCVLSKLDEQTELPAILTAVAPGSASANEGHHHP